MRDPQRIDRILSQVRELWLKVPDWRLGQLLVVAVEPQSPCPDVFHIEDSQLEHRIARLADSLKQQGGH